MQNHTFYTILKIEFLRKHKNFYTKIKSIAQNMQWTWSPPRMWGKEIAGVEHRPNRRITPRVWGKAVAVDHGLAEIRITPTCVGKRLRDMPNWSEPRDHPHACGEKVLSKMIPESTLGSPPRMWGNAVCTTANSV